MKNHSFGHMCGNTNFITDWETLIQGLPKDLTTCEAQYLPTASDLCKLDWLVEVKFYITFALCGLVCFAYLAVVARVAYIKANQPRDK